MPKLYKEIYGTIYKEIYGDDGAAPVDPAVAINAAITEAKRKLGLWSATLSWEVNLTSDLAENGLSGTFLSPATTAAGDPTVTVAITNPAVAKPADITATPTSTVKITITLSKAGGTDQTLEENVTVTWGTAKRGVGELGEKVELIDDTPKGDEEVPAEELAAEIEKAGEEAPAEETKAEEVPEEETPKAEEAPQPEAPKPAARKRTASKK